MFLLDTAIIYELRKKRPNVGVVSWVSKQQDDRPHLSVVTLGEIERGIEKRCKADAKFADALAVWLASLMRLYADGILPVTPNVARRCGSLIRCYKFMIWSITADHFIPSPHPIAGSKVPVRCAL